MKITIDPIKCQGYGTCVDYCPELLELDEWGFAGVLDDGEVPERLEEHARAAARLCPEKAVVLLNIRSTREGTR